MSVECNEPTMELTRALLIKLVPHILGSKTLEQEQSS